MPQPARVGRAGRQFNPRPSKGQQQRGEFAPLSRTTNYSAQMERPLPDHLTAGPNPVVVLRFTLVQETDWDDRPITVFRGVPYRSPRYRVERQVLEEESKDAAIKCASLTCPHLIVDARGNANFSQDWIIGSLLRPTSHALKAHGKVSIVVDTADGDFAEFLRLVGLGRLWTIVSG